MRPECQCVKERQNTVSHSQSQWAAWWMPLTYAQKILQGDNDVAATNNFQREIYRKSEVLSLKIRIWTTNGQAPYSLVVSNPTAPWFHPKDCEPITTLIGQKACVTYASEWILTNVAIKVKPDCVDGPRAKRRLSESSSQYQTPSPIRTRTSSDLSSESEDELPDPDEPLGSKISVTTQQPTLGSTQAQTVSTTSAVVFTPKFLLEYACERDVAFRTMASQSGAVANRFRNTFHLPFYHQAIASYPDALFLINLHGKACVARKHTTENEKEVEKGSNSPG
ncbi:hypothetical protein R3P38DRAFT_3600749 [Favolaschia claudopus]|uniref:Uncharacterized protein n=1 Tax=Favolaschia claudopus TaxID=2862362 RepID=A0AAW0AEK0_9AGAR